MKKSPLALAAVATLAISVASPAHAENGWVPGVAAGIIGGAIVGGAIASSPYYGPGYYGPGYYHPGYYESGYGGPCYWRRHTWRPIVAGACLYNCAIATLRRRRLSEGAAAQPVKVVA